MTCGLWVHRIDSVACVHEWERDSILSSAHSLPLSPAEPLYLPHLAHGANGNQPFSGEQKRKRDRKRKLEMQALSLSLMEPSEASGRRKPEDGAGVDCSERDRGWQRCRTRKLVENLRAGWRNKDERTKMKDEKNGRKKVQRKWPAASEWPDASNNVLQRTANETHNVRACSAFVSEWSCWCCAATLFSAKWWNTLHLKYSPSAGQSVREREALRDGKHGWTEGGMYC